MLKPMKAIRVHEINQMQVLYGASSGQIESHQTKGKVLLDT
jgi:hypothetical protein